MQAETDELVTAMATGDGLSQLLAAAPPPDATLAPAQPPQTAQEAPTPALVSSSLPPNPRLDPAAAAPSALGSRRDRVAAALEASRSRSKSQASCVATHP